MKHHKARTVLIVLAVVTTVLFLVGIPVSFPAHTGTSAFAIVWVILAILLLPNVLSMLCMIVVNMLHAYIIEWEDREEALRQKRADREHYYQHRRKIRELELEQYRQLLRPHRYRIKRCARHLRHLKRRRKDD